MLLMFFLFLFWQPKPSRRSYSAGSASVLLSCCKNDKREGWTKQALFIFYLFIFILAWSWEWWWWGGGLTSKPGAVWIHFFDCPCMKQWWIRLWCEERWVSWPLHRQHLRTTVHIELCVKFEEPSVRMWLCLVKEQLCCQALNRQCG